MKIGQVYRKTSTFTVTDVNEETGVIKGVNDVGAEIIMLKKDVERMYTLKNDRIKK